jgi:hypothetical protein
MRMRKRRLVPGIVLAAWSLCAAGTEAQGPRQDGMWEVKVEVSMAGLDIPPQTQTQCITPEQVRSQGSETLPGLPGGGTCKRTDYQAVGNRVTFKLKCEGALALDGTADMIYAGDTYTGTFTADLAGQPLSVKYSGKRLGDCTK